MSSGNVQFTVPLKNTGTAYLWWFFLGGVGAHKFYLGRPGIGTLYAFTLGLFVVGNIVDLFTLPSQVRRANRRMIDEAGRLYDGSEPGPLAAPPRAINFETYRSPPSQAVAIANAQPAGAAFGRRV